MQGVQLLLAGSVPEHDGRYAPTAPQVARAARMALDKRVDAESLERRLHPVLPAPDFKYETSEPTRKEFVARELARAGIDVPDKRTPDATRAHVSFGRDPDMSPEAGW